MDSVYIEISIASFYHETRRDVESLARKHWTRYWWVERRGFFACHTSIATIDELERAAGGAIWKQASRQACLAGSLGPKRQLGNRAQACLISNQSSAFSVSSVVKSKWVRFGVVRVIRG
jgi:hypothetical protein